MKLLKSIFSNCKKAVKTTVKTLGSIAKIPVKIVKITGRRTKLNRLFHKSTKQERDQKQVKYNKQLISINDRKLIEYKKINLRSLFTVKTEFPIKFSHIYNSKLIIQIYTTYPQPDVKCVLTEYELLDYKLTKYESNKTYNTRELMKVLGMVKILQILKTFDISKLYKSLIKPTKIHKVIKLCEPPKLIAFRKLSKISYELRKVPYELCKETPITSKSFREILNNRIQKSSNKTQKNLNQIKTPNNRIKCKLTESCKLLELANKHSKLYKSIQRNNYMFIKIPIIKYIIKLKQ